MATLTISLPAQLSHRVDAETKKQGYSTRSEFIRHLIRRYFAEELPVLPFVSRPLEEIRSEFEKTGKYNKQFIDSLIRGLAESSAYAN